MARSTQKNKVYVKGYTKKDGTKVPDYYRSNPNTSSSSSSSSMMSGGAKRNSGRRK